MSNTDGDCYDFVQGNEDYVCLICNIVNKGNIEDKVCMKPECITKYFIECKKKLVTIPDRDYYLKKKKPYALTAKENRMFHSIWRFSKPYLFRINETDKTYYKLNREYLLLNNTKEDTYIKLPKSTIEVYIYNDNSKPTSIKACNQVNDNIYELEKILRNNNYIEIYKN
jgi:hypothetical protein